MNEAIHILLIDDNAADRLLVIRELRGAFPDLQVTQIIDGEGFARVLQGCDFDLAVTDYQLRWSDGLAVLRTLKTRWPERPVIMLTGTDNEEIAVQAMKDGADDYRLKSPPHFNRLPIVVRTVWEQVGARQLHKESKNRYLNLFDGVPVGLFRVTSEGLIVDANPALVQMLGYPDQQSLMAVNIQDLFVDSAQLLRFQQEMVQQGAVKDFLVKFRKRDGTLMDCLLTSTVRHAGDGGILGYQGMIRDVTEFKRLEQQFRQAQKMEAIGRLAGGGLRTTSTMC
jgi:PAS domain S-box-containing protein